MYAHQLRRCGEPQGWHVVVLVVHVKQVVQVVLAAQTLQRTTGGGREQEALLQL